MEMALRLTSVPLAQLNTALTFPHSLPAKIKNSYYAPNAHMWRAFPIPYSAFRIPHSASFHSGTDVPRRSEYDWDS